MEQRELITVGEAMKRLGVSNHTIARIIREGQLTVFRNALDRRQKLLDAAEVERLRQPEPEGKAAA